MTVHLVKLCVGAESVDDLADWIERRLGEARESGKPVEQTHTTRMVPSRRDDILDGGSLYWVIKGVIQVRQRIIGFGEGQKPDGTPCCLILLDRKLVPTHPVPRRAFQGWRYLEPADAPPDLDARTSQQLAQLPPEMRKELAELGLI